MKHFFSQLCANLFWFWKQGPKCVLSCTQYCLTFFLSRRNDTESFISHYYWTVYSVPQQWFAGTYRTAECGTLFCLNRVVVLLATSTSHVAMLGVFQNGQLERRNTESYSVFPGTVRAPWWCDIKVSLTRQARLPVLKNSQLLLLLGPSVLILE